MAGPRTRGRGLHIFGGAEDTGGRVWQARDAAVAGRHMHAGVGAGAGGKTLPKQASGGRDLHVDASAVI